MYVWFQYDTGLFGVACTYVSVVYGVPFIHRPKMFKSYLGFLFLERYNRKRIRYMCDAIRTSYCQGKVIRDANSNRPSFGYLWWWKKILKRYFQPRIVGRFTKCFTFSDFQSSFLSRYVRSPQRDHSFLLGLLSSSPSHMVCPFSTSFGIRPWILTLWNDFTVV